MLGARPQATNDGIELLLAARQLLGRWRDTGRAGPLCCEARDEMTHSVSHAVKVAEVAAAAIAALECRGNTRERGRS